MDIFIVVAAGIATAFNIIIIKYKFDKGRNADAILDLAILLLLSFVFSSTVSGMEIGMIASMLFSLYLLYSPFELSSFEEMFQDDDNNNNFVTEEMLKQNEYKKLKKKYKKYYKNL